jgi:hypothetical protein
VSHRRWVAYLYASLFGASGVALFGHTPLLGGLLVVSALFMVRPPLEWPTERTRNSPRRRVRAEADQEGLSLGGKRVLARSEIAAAYYHPATRTVRFRPHAQLLRRRREIEVRDEAEARELLDALHLAPSQCAATYDEPIAPKVIRAVLSVTVLLMLLIGLVGDVSAWWQFALGFLLVEIGALFYRNSIRIGADGVLVGRRFMPWRQVKSVIEKKTGAVLVLDTGKRVRLSHRDGAAVGARAREELAAFRARESRAEAELLLARGTRSTDQWLRDLRAMTNGPGYREGALPVEHLWRVVEDSAATPGARAGAAIALQGALDEDGRARLRAAAETSAAPRVRVALETASRAADDAELAAALEEAADEEAAARAR